MPQQFSGLFSRRGLSLDRLHVLLSVADAGGIAKAAGDDPIRQSQYSRQLKELAEYFGVELTRREGKSLSLTQAGRRLADIVREYLTALSDFDADAHGKMCEIVIGAGDSVIHWLLLPRIQALQDKFPSVNVNLRNRRTDEINEGIREMSLDFGIMRGDSAPDSVRKCRLGRLEYALFLPATFKGQKKCSDPAKILAEFPLVVLNLSGELARQFDVVTSKMRVVPLVKMQCDSLPQAFQAVETGRFAAVLPMLAKPFAESRGISIIRSKLFSGMGRDIDLIWNPRLERVRPLIAQLADFIKDGWKF